MAELRLEVRDFAGLDRWRWELIEPDGGRVLARHEVRLDRGCAPYEAFLDIPGHVRRHAAPDQRVEREREIVREVGAWIGAEILGPLADVLRAAAPVVVRVVVPPDVPEARRLLYVPLELAHVDGRPLALRGVSLVMQVGDAYDAPEPVAVGRPVRVLALFSQPEGSRALNLRRERLALTRLFAGAGRDVEVRTLQYGVTRERLREVLAEGWDVLHVSGHGAPGELLLETGAGGMDRIRAEELGALLAVARGVSLVTVSACWSGALTVREQRRALGLPTTGVPVDEGAPPDVVGALAGELVARLGCAVLAMRYPVADRFAIALAEGLYRRLIIEGLPLPQALGGVLSEGESALEAGTPALFGARAAGLRQAAPPRRAPHVDAPQLPPLPDHFVGRVPLMARAGAALGPRSGLCGVLLQGMPGVGKTACARELVATHAHAFDEVVWFKVPERVETDAGAVLAELAVASGLEVADGRFEEFTAAVTRCLQRRRLLLVVDHLDGLLTPSGTWRDERWGALLAALSGHSGPGRLILTGRVRPPGPGPRVPTEPVDLLNPDEALLLVRELPHLARLADGRAPGMTPGAARRHLTGLLDVTQGHPKLLELADGQAADPARLTALLGSAGRAWAEAGGVPEGFFTADRTTARDGDYARVLRAWADGIADALAPAPRDLFHVLCCLEEPDRTRPALDHNWPGLRAGLGHPDEPLDPLLDTLVTCGLLTRRSASMPNGPRESYDIQAAVAAEGRARAGETFRQLVDTRMSGYWVRVFEMAWTREGTDAEGAHLAGPVLARAGLSAAPYLIRLRMWQGAEALLQAVLRRDGSRATRARVLPVLRRLAALAASGTGAPPPRGALAEVLWATDPAAAERQARTALAEALERGDHTAAALAAGSLAGLCLRTGRLDDALAFADAEIAHARESGLGVWTRLLGEVHRLHVLVERGESGRVVAEAAVLLRRMREVPRERVGAEGVLWWEVWEELCDTAQRAAVDAEEWRRALEYHAELCASLAGRGAPAAELAQARFPAYMPLLRLGRTQEASALLEECREVFEAAADDLHLGEVFGALATVADARGRGEMALARGRDCLRYAYRAGVPATIAISHANFGTYLHSHARDGSGAVAHHLAGALLGVLTGGGRTAHALGAVAGDLREFGADARLPDDPDALYARVGQVPGVDLGRLLDRLVPDSGRVREALAELVRKARGEAEGGALAGAVWGMAWEPAIAALVSGERGNTAARVKLRQHLARYGGMAPRFAALTDVLRRVLDGERDPGVTAGLGPLDAAVARRALGALRGEEDVAAELWPAMHLGLALGNFVATAAGHRGTDDANRADLDGFHTDPVLRALAPVLEEILAGIRGSRGGCGSRRSGRWWGPCCGASTGLREGWVERSVEGGPGVEEPRLNDVRLGPDGSLEFFDGVDWVAYPDVPDDEGAPPNAVSRGDAPGGDGGTS
ncbi:CHAT domain-containing protein [Streptomyces sp. TRM70350]|uniref:CHAT domain-containing protein n=1 Tax=Streptomyces sp. TRM70350 TaxID=2856165 RepID=UPI001C470333|nr:CHAT domain-containing protein [Streptomyces sp. TRM70350]MBV7696688.1 CHAT domain-containing protein [Streptomyces sp. TRM70350]